MKQRMMAFLESLIKKNAMIGVFIGMFLESSFVPIPSEAVLVAFGTSVPVRVVTIAGTLGSVSGSIVGYYIGLKGGQPLIRAIGPYIGVKPSAVDPKNKNSFVNKFFRFLGHDLKIDLIFAAIHKHVPFIPWWVLSTVGIAVLISRCIPFIPFKVFSICSGLFGLPLAPFLLYTAIGSVPRCFILATVGHKLEPYKRPVLIGLGVLVLAYIAKMILHH